MGTRSLASHPRMAAAPDRADLSAQDVPAWVFKDAVLVVDDEAAILRFLKPALEANGRDDQHRQPR